MDFDQARAVRRPTIRVGRRYHFYSTTHDARVDQGTGPLVRMFTGERVLVVAQTFKPSDPDWVPGESERMYRVRTSSGLEFVAYQGELNGWFWDTGQFYGPSGTFGFES